MNSYAKLVEIIGQKRAVIDKLRAELAPLEEVLVMLEKDYDEISSLRLQLRNAIRCDAPEPENPAAAPAAPPEPGTPVRTPVTHTTKQQQIFDALTEPMSIGQLRAALPHIKSVDSLIKVLRLKGVVELNKTDWRYRRVTGVADVPKTPPDTTA